MGTCHYCGEDAGFLRRIHRECQRLQEEKRAQRAAARARLLEQAAAAAIDTSANGREPLDALDAELRASALAADEQRGLHIEALAAAIGRALDDDLLSHEEEAAIDRYAERFGLDRASDPALYAVLWEGKKAVTIRQICEGTVPEFQYMLTEDSDPVPFNFQKSETLVWLMSDVDYYQLRTRREFRGGSTGASIRVAKGFYLRHSGFRGHPVSVEEVVKADTGLLGVTTKHLYFHGARERFRVRFDRIVSFQAYDDGLGIMRDLARAKPETFRASADDGWFLYNLVTNLARL